MFDGFEAGTHAVNGIELFARTGHFIPEQESGHASAELAGFFGL